MPLWWVLSVIVLLEGCQIMSYRPLIDPTQPSDAVALGSAGELSYFFYTPAANPATASSPVTVEFVVMRRVFQQIAKAHMALGPVAHGTYVQAHKTQKARSSAADVACTLAIGTLTVIPCYSGTGGYTVEFLIVRDGEPLETYSYDILQKRFIWLGTIPLFWVNFLTPSYEKAFEEVTWQFVHDAKQKGHL